MCTECSDITQFQALLVGLAGIGGCCELVRVVLLLVEEVRWHIDRTVPDCAIFALAVGWFFGDNGVLNGDFSGSSDSRPEKVSCVGSGSCSWRSIEKNAEWQTGVEGGCSLEGESV